ncbi:unnamed protein product [Linum trigynum]|uniref:F-box domain-containing protein n=1 Tax=Linum trigynum TaxID=586398 RepID=A0AAV2D1J6_9ROSI
MISKLGDDLLLEILIRLPNPRSACRCKSVSKRWSFLISDPSFNRRFVSHHQRPPLLLPSNDPQSIIPTILPVPTDVDGLRFSVLDSFEDLLLCGVTFPEDIDAEFSRSYFVCNVFTKQWIALPLAPEIPPGCVAVVPRLVCEPAIFNNLDMGDGEASVCYSEYRFRVVCICQCSLCIKLYVFCSETGEWTKEAVVLDGDYLIQMKNVLSCNGELFFVDLYEDEDGDVYPLIAVINPFRLDMRPTYLDARELLVTPKWDIAVSQGALHVILLEEERTPDCSMAALTVWKLQEDPKTWRKVREGAVKTTPRCMHREMADIEHCEKAAREQKTSTPNYEVDAIIFPSLHPDNPEIVFFHCFSIAPQCVILSCDLTRGELEFFSYFRARSLRWAVFQPKVSCSPSPIRRYEELKLLYNGSYSCWVQSSKTTTLSITG